MRATIRRAVEAHKAQREENGEAGFSLIELIIVVVILGILAAIAIPIFLNIQDEAKQNAAEAIAGNAATQAASQVAQGATPDVSDLDPDGSGTASTVVLDPAAPTTVDAVCAKVTHEGKSAQAGPGC